MFRERPNTGPITLCVFMENDGNSPPARSLNKFHSDTVSSYGKSCNLANIWHICCEYFANCTVRSIFTSCREYPANIFGLATVIAESLQLCHINAGYSQTKPKLF